MVLVCHALSTYSNDYTPGKQMPWDVLCHAVLFYEPYSVQNV